jgi:hypothetical protein
VVIPTAKKSACMSLRCRNTSLPKRGDMRILGLSIVPVSKKWLTSNQLQVSRLISCVYLVPLQLPIQSVILNSFLWLLSGFRRIGRQEHKRRNNLVTLSGLRETLRLLVLALQALEDSISVTHLTLFSWAHVMLRRRVVALEDLSPWLLRPWRRWEW